MAFKALYTQLFPPKPPLTEKNVPLQLGKIFIVTGGNSGVGFELCKILYTTGATVYLTSRSEQRGKQAIEEITSANPPPKNPGILKFLHLDLNDLNSVKSAASTFASQETKLHVLWNNAGTGAYRVSQGARTAQGLEPMLRIAAAEPSSSARVVWTSSIVTDQGSPANGIDIETLGDACGLMTSVPVETLYTPCSPTGWITGKSCGTGASNSGQMSYNNVHDAPEARPRV